MKKVLNVGGNSKAIPIPAQYAGYEHLLLDIDPAGEPDIVCDARDLATLAPQQFDAVYCSHNLEHYYRHDVPRVLGGFRHVLKDDGFVHIIVPDIRAVMRHAVERDMDLEDTLYESAAGPIMVLDVLYGYGKMIERTGEEFFAHKTGFTQRSLERALYQAGFHSIFTACGNFEVRAVAFKDTPSEEGRRLFGLAG